MNKHWLVHENFSLSVKVFFAAMVFCASFLFLDIQRSQAVVPVWVKQFDKCTQFQISNEQFEVDIHTYLVEAKHKAERSAQLRDIIKAREDINKLVATVYNELRTQQIVNNPNALNPDLRNVLQSLGIVARDTDEEGKAQDNEELCKASYYVKAKIGSEPNQCVAVVQEARFITNQDDYIYEESRRRAMDALSCYLGEWRHFPITKIEDPSNCNALGLDTPCTDIDVWETLGEKVFNDKNAYSDKDGTKTTDVINDDQHVHNLCEGLRGLGEKCAQDMVRDYIKYGTIDKITRKDRTVILAPPQTWYTPDRCRIIESTLPIANQPVSSVAKTTPYTKSIKSLQIIDPTKLNSTQFLNYYFGSKLGNSTLPKPPANMDASEYTASKEFQALNVPENNFSGLASKAEQVAKSIITETTELRKLQYANGDGLRDATLRIGWKDYEWDDNEVYLGKYPALDSPLDNPGKPNKIFKPLPCYWEEKTGTTTGGAIRCEELALNVLPPGLGPTGKTFYFDTGIVIAPISITKSKLQAAIQAQFDLAAKAFDDTEVEGTRQNPPTFGECGAKGEVDLLLYITLPAPWEDVSINLATTINPLTGEPYISDAPGKQNPPFRIPGLPNNFFNFFYNDIFQLYHTPLPDLLAKWFRVDDPDYDSIYGLGEPIDLTAVFAGQGPGGQGAHGPNEPPLDSPVGPLPVGCKNHDFSGQGTDACFLEAIAAAESSCNPNALSSHGACGIMQILPSTASSIAGRTVTCQELQSNPQLSIQLSSQYMQRSENIIQGYRSKGFNIGQDDLIASYNAGWGDKCGSPKQPFCPSTDCPNPPTPSWQCPINPGGFKQTQVYVGRVLNYQEQCKARKSS